MRDAGPAGRLTKPGSLPDSGPRGERVEEQETEATGSGSRHPVLSVPIGKRKIPAQAAAEALAWWSSRHAGQSVVNWCEGQMTVVQLSTLPSVG